MSNEVLIPNFFKVGCNGDKSIKKEDLGQSDSIKRDAQSDNPEKIFCYIVEMLGFYILFYWKKDRQWHTIETEKDPIEVRRIYSNPNWDGICEMTKADLNGEPHTSSNGEIIATFESPIEVWGKLRINDVPIGEVLKNSVITDLD